MMSPPDRRIFGSPRADSEHPDTHQTSSQRNASYRVNPRFLLATGLIVALSPIVLIGTGYAVPYGSLLPFYLLIAALLLAVLSLARVCIRWWEHRPDLRGAGTPEYLWITAVALGVVGNRILAGVIGTAYGVHNGGTWFRVRRGTPLDGDYELLLSFGLSWVALGGTVLATALLMVSRLSTSPWTQLSTAAQAARERLTRMPEPRHLRYATTRDEPLWSRILSPGPRALLALGAAGSVIAVPVAALSDGPEGEAALWFLLAAPVAVSLWSTAEPLWRPDEQFGVILLSLIRLLVIPLGAGLVLGAASFLPAVLPALWSGYGERAWPDTFFLGVFETTSSLSGWLIMNALIGLLFSIIGGLGITLLVVCPWIAFFRPDQAIADNMLSQHPEHRRTNIVAIRALSLLLPLIFVIPGLMNWGRMHSTPWWIGVALIPVAVLLTGIIWWKQRVDHTRRRRWGLQAPISGPNDPKPPRNTD